jgi:hypothetical protein
MSTRAALQAAMGLHQLQLGVNDAGLALRNRVWFGGWWGERLTAKRTRSPRAIGESGAPLVCDLVAPRVLAWRPPI